MSAAETYYVVRDEEGSCLGWRDDLHGTLVLDYIGDNPLDINTERWMSRKEAEVKAAEHGGKVRRVTVTTEDVGLRWVPRYAYPEHEAGLWDGRREVAAIQWDNIHPNTNESYRWYLPQWPLANTALRGKCASIEEAKAAAEAAVKATWT